MLSKKIKRNEDNHAEDINPKVINLDYIYKEIEKEIKSKLEEIKAYFKNKSLYLNSKHYKLLIFNSPFNR